MRGWWLLIEQDSQPNPASRFHESLRACSLHATTARDLEDTSQPQYWYRKEVTSFGPLLSPSLASTQAVSVRLALRRPGS